MLKSHAFGGLSSIMLLLCWLGCSDGEEPALAAYGASCATTDCLDGLCLDLGGGVKVCSQTCDSAACPGGDPCLTTGSQKVCKPNSAMAPYGASCQDKACRSGLCVDVGGGKKLCSQECGSSTCPKGDPCITAGGRKICKASDGPCTLKTCSSLGKKCGKWDDGCGGKISCGTCPASEVCRENGTCGCSGCKTTGPYEISDMGKRYVTLHKSSSYVADVKSKFGDQAAKDVVDKSCISYKSMVSGCCCSPWVLKEGERGTLLGTVSLGAGKTVYILKLSLCNDACYLNIGEAGVRKSATCLKDEDCGSNAKCDNGFCKSKCSLTCSKTGFTYTCSAGIKSSKKKMCKNSSTKFEELIVEYTNGRTVTCKAYCQVSGIKCSDDTGAVCNK